MSSFLVANLEYCCAACGAFLLPDDRTETEAGPMHPRCAAQAAERREAPRPMLLGPVSLEEALAAGEGAVRLAVSVPHGDWIGVRAGGATLVRRVNQRQARESGIASRLGTGEWLPAAECPVHAWRPA